MSAKNDLLKNIMHDLKDTKRMIKEQEKDRDLENPIDIDIVKTLKSNFYELALEHYKKYKKSREE